MAPNVYEYKGVTNEPTEDTLINPNGSFTDGQDWNGAYSSVDPNSGVCLGKLPPGPNDNLVVGPVSNGTSLVSTTIGGGGGAYQSLTAAGAPPSSGVTLTLDTNGSPFAGNIIAQAGEIDFKGGMSSGAQLILGNVDQQNPAQYTLEGGTYAAASAIFIGGATVTAPSGAALVSPQVHDDGDIELGGKLNASSFLTVGEFGFGRLNIESGAEVTSGDGFIGGFAGSNGTVIVNGIWETEGELIDGQLGTGSLTVGQGGVVRTGDFMTVGAGANTLSTLTINNGGQVVLTAISGEPTDLALNTAVVPLSTALVAVDGAGSKLFVGGALNVGYAGTATMEVTAGGAVDVTGAIVRVGRLAGSTGTLNLTGGNSSFTLANGTTFQIGTFGTGALNVTGGFQLNTGTAAVGLGQEAGSQGTVLISDPGSKWTVGLALFSIGVQGHGSLTVSNGGSLDVSSSVFDIGALPGGTGDLTLSGASSSIALPSLSTFDIGDLGHANLVLNQGFALDTGGANIVLGAQAGGIGFASIDGAGTSWKIGGALTIGDQGTGELDVTGGGALTVNGGTLAVGNSQSGGKLVLSGATSSLTMSNAKLFNVGSGGDGEVDVSGGFQLDTGTTSVVLGATGGMGVVDLSDPQTNWTMGGSLTVGQDANGLIAIGNGATLTVSPGATLTLGAQAGSAGFLTLDGSASKLVTDGAKVQIGGSGAGFLTIQNGATLDWSAQAVTLGEQDGSSGTIQVLGGGTFKVGQLTLGLGGSGALLVGDVTTGTKGALTVIGDVKMSTGDGDGEIGIQSGSQATFGGNLTLGVLGNSTLTLAGASTALVKGDLAVAPQGSPSVSSVMVQGGSSLTVNGQLDLNGSLDVDASTVEVDGGLQMGDMEITLKNGSTFNSTSSSGADFVGSLPGKIDVLSGSHMTLTGALFSEDGSSPLAITVDGNSTLTATILTSRAFGASSLTITGGSQLSLTGQGCSCAALTWQEGTISVSGGSVLSAPTASIGEAGLSSSLTLMTSGAAAFSNNLMLQPGSTLDVTGGGIVVVGAPSSGGGGIVISPGGGQVSVNPGGILKGVAGGAPAIVNGNVQINAGGLLAGTLNINGKVVNTGAHLLGDDPSTVTVNGAYTLGPTGVIIAEVGPTSYSQLIVNGPVTLNGGTLEFEPVQGGAFKIGATYNVLTASGGVTGAFGDITVAQPAGMPFIQLSADFVDGSLEVTAQHMPGSFASVATSANQHAVAAALDSAAPTATGALGDFVNMLSNSDAATVQADFDPLSGEAYGAFAEAGIQANRDFAAALRGAAAQTSGREGSILAFDALRQALAADGAVGDPSIWMAALGNVDHASGVGGSHSAEVNAGGLAGGVDLSPAPHWALGGAFGYVHSDLGVGPQGSGTLATYQGALYGGYSGSRLYVDAAAGYAQSNGALQRQLAPAAVLTASGQVHASQSFASGEAGVDVGTWSGALVTPFAALDAVSYDQAAFTETGAAGLGLAIDGRRTQSVRSDLGVQLSASQHGDSPFEASFRIGWGHEFADPARPVAGAFIGAPGVPFTVEGAPGDRDFAVVGVGIGARLRGGVRLSARYDANLSSRTSEQLLSLDARVAW